MLFRLLWRWASWEIVSVSANLEIEQNRLTGEYRYRHVGAHGDRLTYGRWFPGLPFQWLSPLDFHDEPSAAELAQMLRPQLRDGGAW